MNNKSNLKLAIIKQLALMDGDYEFLCEVINQDVYRKILKMPVEPMMFGLSDCWKNRTKEEVFPVLKEVIEDVLQSDGIELTFTDEDWPNLKIIQEENKDYRGNIYYKEKLNTNKTYMGEFFEC